MEPNPYEAPNETESQSKATPSYPWGRLCLYGLGMAVAGRCASYGIVLIAPPITTNPIIIFALLVSYGAFVVGVGGAVVGAAGWSIGRLLRSTQETA